MSNLFGTIRDMDSQLLEDIRNDPACFSASHIAPVSYYKAAGLYTCAEDADFGTMCAAMYERSQVIPDNINSYHEWIALYMFGEYLTDEEANHRQVLARKLSE